MAFKVIRSLLLNIDTIVISVPSQVFRQVLQFILCRTVYRFHRNLLDCNIDSMAFPYQGLSRDASAYAF